MNGYNVSNHAARGQPICTLRQAACTFSQTSCAIAPAGPATLRGASGLLSVRSTGTGASPPMLQGMPRQQPVEVELRRQHLLPVEVRCVTVLCVCWRQCRLASLPSEHRGHGTQGPGLDSNDTHQQICSREACSMHGSGHQQSTMVNSACVDSLLPLTGPCCRC
jgi:hypothetical protein